MAWYCEVEIGDRGMIGSKLIFFCKVILVFILLNAPLSVFSQRANLVSNVDGKIRVLILHYGNGAYFDGFWFDMTVLFRDLLEKKERFMQNSA